MKVTGNIVLLLLLLGALSFKNSTEGYEVGSRVENFTLYDLMADSTFSLNSYKQKKCVVVIFDANSCAYSQRYRDRVIALHTQFKDQEVQFVLINSNKAKLAPKESNSEMRKLIKTHHIKFPYLVDGKGRIATTFGARKNPECFVLKPKNESFRVAYRGSIDDNAQLESEVTHRYLHDAISAILNRQSPEIDRTPTVGCMIRK